MLGSGMNLITTIIGFGMSATFIVFVCTRLICRRIRGLDSRPMFEIDTTTVDPSQPVHRINGLEPVLVAAIPTVRFSREAFSSVEDAQCSICLADYEEKEVLRVMPQCGHNFHLSCIDIWLKKQSTCPVCRFPLHHSFETKHVRQANLSLPQSTADDSIEISIEHSRQWLISGTEPSVGNINSELQVEVVPRLRD